MNSQLSTVSPTPFKEKSSWRMRTALLLAGALAVFGSTLIVLSADDDAQPLQSVAPTISSALERSQVPPTAEPTALDDDAAAGVVPADHDDVDSDGAAESGEDRTAEELPTRDDGADAFEHNPPAGGHVTEDPRDGGTVCEGGDYIQPSHGDRLDPETGQFETIDLAQDMPSNCGAPPCCEASSPGVPQWDSEPINTEPDARVEVSPEHPVEGDLVTVRIHWRDAEADVVSAQYGCDFDGQNGTGICFDGPTIVRCPVEGVQPLPPPSPGSGTIEFSFTAGAVGRYDWDRGFVVQSVVGAESSECTPPDPYEDHFSVSWSVEVASNIDGTFGTGANYPGT